MSELSGYWRHIEACNPATTEEFIPWSIEKKTVGWVRPWLADRLQREPDVFLARGNGLEMCPSLETFEERSDALAGITEKLVQEVKINPLMGERYPVTPDAREDALAVIDRSAGAYFGIRSFGQHLNAYVRHGDDLLMWVGRRARDRLVFPGYLDNMVAGGLPGDVSMAVNLLK